MLVSLRILFFSTMMLVALPVLSVGSISAPESTGAKGSVSTSEVPDVVGQSEARALRTITRAGFVLGEITRASSSTVPEDLIISQDPAAGAEAVLGSEVSLVISTGASVGEGEATTREVPSVVGLPRSTADFVLTEAGFILGAVTTQPSSTLVEGQIISQDPAAGVEALLGS